MSVAQQHQSQAPTAPSMIPTSAKSTAQTDQSYRNLLNILGEDSKRLDWIPIDDIVIEDLRNDEIPMEDRRKKDVSLLRYKMRIGIWTGNGTKVNNPTVWAYLAFIKSMTLPHVLFFKTRKRLRRTEKIKLSNVFKNTTMDHLDGIGYDRYLAIFVTVCFILKRVPFPEVLQFPMRFRELFKYMTTGLGKNMATTRANVPPGRTMNWSEDLPRSPRAPDRRVSESSKRGSQASTSVARQSRCLEEVLQDEADSEILTHRRPFFPQVFENGLFFNVSPLNVSSSRNNSEAANEMREAESGTHNLMVEPSYAQQYGLTTNREGSSKSAAAVNQALQRALEPVTSLIRKRKTDEEELETTRNKISLEGVRLNESELEIASLVEQGEALQQQLERIMAEAAAIRTAREGVEGDFKALYEVQKDLQSRIDQSRTDETEMLAGLGWLTNKP